MQRTKKTYLTRPLTADVARSLGLEQYYLPCRKAFDGVIRTLDAQVGRPLMLISAQTKGKEPEDILVSDYLELTELVLIRYPITGRTGRLKPFREEMSNQNWTCFERASPPSLVFCRSLCRSRWDAMRSVCQSRCRILFSGAD